MQLREEQQANPLYKRIVYAKQPERYCIHENNSTGTVGHFRKKYTRSKSKNVFIQIENDTIDIASADISKRGVSVISPGASFALAISTIVFLPMCRHQLDMCLRQKPRQEKRLEYPMNALRISIPMKLYNVQYNYFVDVFFGAKQPHNAFYFLRDTKVFIGYLFHCEGMPSKKTHFVGP